MLSRRLLTATLRCALTARAAGAQPRAAPQDNMPGLTDLGSLPKGINYREDFDQGLTDEEKKSMKRFDIYR